MGFEMNLVKSIFGYPPGKYKLHELFSTAENLPELSGVRVVCFPGTAVFAVQPSAVPRLLDAVNPTAVRRMAFEGCPPSSDDRSQLSWKVVGWGIA